MTEKRYDVIDKEEPRGQSVTWDGIPCTARTCVTRLNRLTEENEKLKSRFHRERELAMRLSRECDALTIKKQELELEIVRLEEIIKTGKR